MKTVAKNIILAVVVVLSGATVHAQSWTQQSALASDPVFIERVKMSMVSRAVLIVQGETSATVNYAARQFLARQVVSNPDQWGRNFAVATAADTTIRATSTDTEINSRVASLWNSFAMFVPPTP